MDWSRALDALRPAWESAVFPALSAGIAALLVVWVEWLAERRGRAAKRGVLFPAAAAVYLAVQVAVLTQDLWQEALARFLDWSPFDEPLAPAGLQVPLEWIAAVGGLTGWAQALRSRERRPRLKATAHSTAPQPGPAQVEPPIPPNELPAPPDEAPRPFAEPGTESTYEPLAAPLSPAPRPRPPARYANAVLLEAGERLPPDRPLRTRQLLRLRLDIGPLSAASHVEAPAPFPDDLLPRRDLDLDVMVSSTDFDVARDEEGLAGSRLAHGRFVLPGDGGAARAQDGGEHLHFFVRAPAEAGAARARIGYYYRNALVQSQLLAAEVGVEAGGFTVQTDFTLSERLLDLEEIPDRPRASLLTNESGDGDHQIVLRELSAEGSPQGAAFHIPHARLAGEVAKFRQELDRADFTELSRSRRQLEEDLRRLAPAGRKLYEVVGLLGRRETFTELFRRHRDVVVSVARPRGARFEFPWSFLYEIPLDAQAVDRGDLALCPLVAGWDGRRPLVEGEARECPHFAGRLHPRNTLCPFGFWGLRYSIEQLSSTDRVVRRLDPPGAFEVAVGHTDDVASAEELERHFTSLGEALAGAFPRAKLVPARTAAEVRSAIGKDLPLVYFYSHGRYAAPRGADTLLVVGEGDWVSPGDILGWIQEWDINEGRKVWDRQRPLVFLNACHSLEVRPQTLLSYLDVLVSVGGAAGVIGTEVRVEQRLARAVAERFFRRFLGERWSVDRALRDVRLHLLRHGNLLGLVYTPYCWADLAFEPGPAS